MGDGAGAGARLFELLAALSLGTDLGMGHPTEHVLRQRFIALGAAERIGLRAAEREVVRRSSLLVWKGRHVDASEQAKWFGEDLVLKHDVRWVDHGTVSDGAGVPAARQVPSLRCALTDTARPQRLCVGLPAGACADVLDDAGRERGGEQVRRTGQVVTLRR